MHRIVVSVLTLFLYAVILTTTAFAESSVPLIPVVPAAKAKANLKPPPQQNNNYNMKRRISHSEQFEDRSQVPMEPGVNEIIQVSVNHLNRIVTPYSEPKITTSSPATTEVRDNVIYIGTTQEIPITLFITEKGIEDQALSLTLIPRKIPPREIFLQLKGGSKALRYTKRAEKWEQSQPYVSTIEQLFRTLALGELPPGYSFTTELTGELPSCRQTGLEFDFEIGQTVLGHNLIVYIGVAKNASPKALEFIENTCGDWDVAAVAAFPRNVIHPGEQTEIYVAKKRHFKREIKVKRPSLLIGRE